MDNKTAIQVIINALEIATQKGCYNLSQTREITLALDYFLSRPDVEFGQITENEKED